MICPLCLRQESTLYHQEKKRSFHQCSYCLLVFVPREELISSEEEKSRYEAHNNNVEDSGYQQYLKNISDNIRPFLLNHTRGLDYGCGRTKLLEELLTSRSITVLSFDLFFHPDSSLLKKNTYDFVILSEVIEHLRNPHEEMNRLKDLLKPGGLVFVKTKLLPVEKDVFPDWFYKRDKTHIQFFNPDSFKFLSTHWNFEEGEMIGEDLFLFRDKRVKVGAQI